MANIRISREKLEEALYEADLWDEDDNQVIRPSYEGRGMYGSSCLGLTVTLPDLLRLSRAVEKLYSVRERLSDEQHRDLCDMLDAVREDQLGHGSIYYFPGYELGD